jgi:haloacetate dehalogenase
MADMYPEVAHHTVRLNGIKQHYVITGDGPPVYLLHGFPETWFGWRKQIPALAQHYTVVAPDLRGYGLSDKPAIGYDKRTMANDVVALMDHLGHQTIALVGHDRGARVSTRFAKDHRGRVDRLAILDNVPTRVLASTFDLERAKAGYWIFPFMGVPDLPEKLIGGGNEEAFLTHLFRTWSYNPQMLSADEVEVYVKNYQQPGALRGSFADYRAMAEDTAQDIEDADVLIDCPVLTMWGAESDVVGKAYDVAEVWRGMAKDVTAIPIPECGHLCQEERPDFVNAELLKFLAGWNGS